MPNTDDQVITWDDFNNFYADISMKVFTEAEFLKLVSDTWGIKEEDHLSVNIYDLEALVGAIRHSLLKYGNERHTEEYVLRELYREFAGSDNNAVLGIYEL